MKRVQFETTNKDGKKVLCEVIATYHDDETNKDFIVYTDRTYNEYKKLNIYYSLYREKDTSIELIEIKDLEDKKIGVQIIQEIIKDLGN